MVQDVGKPLAPRSPEWGRVRAAFLKGHPRCEACGGVEFLECHHIKPYHLFPDLELDTANLITLCERPGRNCHLTWGHFYDWTLWNRDVVRMARAWWKKVARAHGTPAREKTTP